MQEDRYGYILKIVAFHVLARLAAAQADMSGCNPSEFSPDPNINTLIYRN